MTVTPGHCPFESNCLRKPYRTGDGSANRHSSAGTPILESPSAGQLQFSMFDSVPFDHSSEILSALFFLEWIEKDPLLTKFGCFSTTPKRSARTRNGSLQTHSGQKSKDEQVDDQKHADLLF
ncbi:hypothetical protein AVEN_35501-1 [Araneus ventricosus]|uniref:Uncharacterized protein n=1 Tax=Araneus ventricosus TaxID=182803 RepID=A0A4Y2NER7_ARAVE|nr:hypothetical protein AVEN_35501-1 [Araneus ventricosus]